MLCEGLQDPSDALRIGERMVTATAEAIVDEENTVQTTASVGVAVARGPGVDAETLMRDADVAMYQAKELGRNRVALFDGDMRLRAFERVDVERELRTAIDSGQLVLHYQPIVDVSARSLVGVEALVRWQHPRRGLLEPNEFIPLAEQCRPDLRPGAWVLDEACRQLASGRKRATPTACHRQPLCPPAGERRPRGRCATPHHAGIRADAALLEVTESAVMPTRRPR